MVEENLNTIKPSNTLVVAPPQKAPDSTLTKKISRALAELEEVREAHLPEVIEIGVSTRARLMLFVVVEPAEKIPAVNKKLGRCLLYTSPSPRDS